MLEKIIGHTLPAKAMFYALLVTLLIALISSSIIMLSYTKHIQQERFFMQERLIRNCESAMTLLKSDPSKILAPTVIDLFNDGTDSVLISKKNWGFFVIGRVKAFTNSLGLSQQFEQIAMFGHSINDSTAVYLADKNKPLSLCGKTEIRGTAFLPRAGVKRAYINGESYIGQELIYGKKQRSKRFLQKPDFSSIEFLLNPALPAKSGLPKQADQSFSIEPLFFHNESVYLNNYELQGQIVIRAATVIRVAANCLLEDVILIAPHIIIEDGFNGKLQAIATDSMIIGKNCDFEYPSVLCLWDNVESTSLDVLHFGNGSSLNGAVLAHDTNRGKKPITIRLEDSTNIHGVLFLEGILQLKGRVLGTVYTEGFVLKTASSIYDNHILNAMIDVTKQSPDFLSPDFMGNKEPWDIVAWLN